MKRSTIITLVAAVLVFGGGFMVGRIGSGATKAELATADSLRAAEHSLAVAVTQRDSIRGVMLRMQAETVTVAGKKVVVVRARTDTLVRTVPDTAMERRLTDALLIERAAEDTLTMALAKDTTDMRVVIHGVTVERDYAMQLQVRTQAALDAALRTRRDPAWGLGATGGYGCVLGSKCGPTLAVGVTWRVKLPFIGGK